MKEKFKKYKEYLIAPLLTILIVLLVYLFKGIYPFGKLTIANGDMGQSYMTFYYLLYDFFHGSKSFLYDYGLGMGSNVYGGVIVDGFLNPSAWLVLLNTRENIPYMFSYVIMTKFAFIALTSYILFKRINKNKKKQFYNYIFSILYALSAYTLMYNTNLMWLDVVGLFPLFIIATKYMFDTNKVSWYAIILALTLIFNYNMAYMVLMFIIFIIPIYIHYSIPKENRKKAVFNLIIGTLLSIGLSAFAFIPSFIQVMSSYRFSGAVKNTVTNSNILFKMGTFCFYGLPIYFYIMYALDHKKDKNNFKMTTIALILSAIIPIIFERVNLWWHMGSYQMFPFRYGFIPIMILYLGVLRYINNLKEEKNTKPITIKGLIIILALSIPTILLTINNAFHINRNIPAFNYDIKAFILSEIMCAVLSVIYFFIELYKDNKLKRIIITTLTLAVVVCYTYAYLGVDPKYREGNEWSDDGIFYANEIYKKHIDTGLYRLKDLSLKNYENYSVITNTPSISTFLHIISKEQVLNTNQLGYSANKTKLNDFGGTIFTDAIYGVKYVISTKELPDRLYTYKDKIENNYLYEYKNVLPYGILYNEEINDIPKEYYAFTANNYIYQKLFNKNDNLIDIKKYTEEGKTFLLTYEIDVVGEKELYLYIKPDLFDHIMTNVTVNNKIITIPTQNYQKGTAYPTSYDNGILDLGYFKDEKVIICLNPYNKEGAEKKFDIEFGLLDINKYEEIFKIPNHNIDVSVNKNKIKVSGNVENDTNIFLPITYDAGFKGNTDIKRVYNTFIGLPLKEGKNNIELTFKPKAYTVCVYVTILTILLMTICHFIRKKFDIRNIKFIMYTFWILGILIYSGFVIKFYIISILETIIDIFK